MPAAEDVFDEPSRWRLAAVRSLGLVGDERIAGIVTGAAYPDALAPIVEALDSVSGLVADVGGGSGGGSQWIAARAGAGVLVVEPVATSATAARELFPSLDVVLGSATALPVADGRCGGVTLLGVVSLVTDLDAVLDEVGRVLPPDGIIAITDLCSAGEAVRAPIGSPNVFRRADVLTAALTAHGVRVTDRWSAPADIETEWDDVGRRVDEEITRQFAGKPAFDDWWGDRRRLRDDIARGALVVHTIVGRREPNARSVTR